MRIECDTYVHPLQDNPKAVSYKSKHLIDYNVLVEIMEDTIADGRENFTTHDSFHPPQTPINEQITIEDKVESQPFQTEMVSTTQVEMPNLASSSRSIKSKQPEKEMISDLVGRMADAMEPLANTQRKML